jgi:hypothetical protein
MGLMADDGSKRVSIRWNGREITDPSELPPEMRKLLEDADGNGIPDIVERGKLGVAPGDEVLEVSVVKPTVIEIGGRTYQSIDELPPQMREPVRAALAQAGKSPFPTAAKPASSVSATATPLPQGAPRPRPVGPSSATLLLAAVAGALVTYLLMRH